MKYWVAYLKEKRVSVMLYLATVLLFLAVCALKHVENMDSLLYAGLLSLFLWAVTGICCGMEYVKRRRRLKETMGYLEQSTVFFPETMWGTDIEWVKTALESDSMEGELLRLLELILSMLVRERQSWEEKSADRSDYYVMWTHQIKTPIAALKLLLENAGENTRDSFLMREELFKIEQYAEMALAYQRLESIASDLVLEEQDLYEMLTTAVKKYSVLFINKGLSLDLQEQHIQVVTDEKWFGFCLEQFLSNSIKYTASGTITLYAEEQGEQVVLYIRDTGLGIRSEDLPRIFERGFTGYNGRIDRRSTGIGLYLCRRVLDHLGISVTVESRVGEGTCVTLVLLKTK